MSLTPYLHLDVDLTVVTEGDAVAVSEAERHHLRKVLRLTEGAAVVVADGGGIHAAAELRADGLVLTATPVAVPPPTPRLVLAQVLPKGRKLDEVVRQATELGVDEVRILTSQRCVVRLPADRAERARQRWEAVARAAAEQARRAHRPPLTGPISLDRLGRDDELLLIAHPAAPGLPTALGMLPGGAPGAGTLVLAIGPEGGFTDTEVAAVVTSGGLAVGLGSTVLRTEHAGAAGLAVLAALCGRWGTGAPV